FKGDPGVVQLVAAGEGLQADNSVPAYPVLSMSSSVLQAIAQKVSELIAGEGIEVDSISPSAPIVSLSNTTLQKLDSIGAVQTSDSDPTSTDIPDGQYAVWHNS